MAVKLLKTNLKSVSEKRSSEKNQNRPLFEITKNGMDVLITRDIGGKWKGFLFSDVRDDHEGQNLLRWIIRSDFQQRVRDIANEMIGA